MNYLSRLIQQSGLRVAVPLAHLPVQGGVQERPDAATDGIEEINIEAPAHSPTGLSDALQRTEGAITPVPGAALPEVSRQTQDPININPPQIIATPDETPIVVSSKSGMERDMNATGVPEDTTPSRKLQEPPTEIQSTITRHETLRQVFDWVAPNEVHQGGDTDDGAGSKPTIRLPDDAPEPPMEPATAIAPEERTEVRAVATDIISPDTKPALATPMPAVEVAMRPGTTSLEKAPLLEIVEERVDISIGAINITVEAPPEPSPAQTPTAIAMMRAPPSAAHISPASPRSSALTSDRLRRRFIKL